MSALTNVMEQVAREDWGRLFAILVNQFEDFALAEESLQDAFASALQHWGKCGVPQSPRAWLLQSAKNKAIDVLRRQSTFDQKVQKLTPLATREERNDLPMSEDSFPDDRLKLIFTCCHPALAQQAQVALTLRTLCGLETADISRAFLVAETTMAQRLVRAKRKIKAAAIPYKIPEPNEWQERLGSVLKVIYLIFNEGYNCTSGPDLIDTDLCEEAIYLGGMLMQLLPSEVEVQGLSALMLLHDSRRESRINAQGEYVGLEEQDRHRWDKEKIHAGERLLKFALAQGKSGFYQLQAAISAEHAKAETFAGTNWRQIKLLYDQLYGLHPTPTVRLNGLVALSFACNAKVALDRLLKLNGESVLENYQPYYAFKADLHKRLGENEMARDNYLAAIRLSNNMVEKRFLEQRLKSLP